MLDTSGRMKNECRGLRDGPTIGTGSAKIVGTRRHIAVLELCGCDGVVVAVEVSRKLSEIGTCCTVLAFRMHVSQRQEELASEGEQPKPCKPRALPNVEQHGASYYIP
jgi:hypothetical protein